MMMAGLPTDLSRVIAIDEVADRENYSEMYWTARSHRWLPDVVRSHPNFASTILTAAKGDTVLHIAVKSRNIPFVEGCVGLESLRAEDFVVPNKDGLIPVHLAALTGQYIMVQHLTSKRLLQVMDLPKIKLLFFYTIHSNMFDVAMVLFQIHPTELATTTTSYSETALHMLARKPSEIIRGSTLVLTLFQNLWSEVMGLKIDKRTSLIIEPSVVLFDTIESGNLEFTKYLLSHSPEPLREFKSGRNLLHFLVLYRDFDNFTYYLSFGETHLLLEMDNEGNSVLHMAARFPPQLQFSSLRANMQMKKEVAWFKRVEEKVPSELRTMRNNNGKTPIEVFYDEHNQLSKDIKETAKGIAESGMVLATLVAVVAFATAVTLPGDKNNVWFVVFILTNAIALFASSASIFSFWSNFTNSRFLESEFVISLHPSLNFGSVLLIISVAAMVVAFTVGFLIQWL